MVNNDGADQVCCCSAFRFSAAFEAQQHLASSATQSISSLLNGTVAWASSGSTPDSLNRVLNSVATVQLQLSALDCASMDCGGGVCVVVAGIPTCDCDGTGFSGQHCDTPPVNATAPNISRKCACIACKRVCSCSSLYRLH